MDPLTRLDKLLKRQGHAIDGLDQFPAGGYRVSPPSMQAACQPTIDTYNPTDPAHAAAELTERAAAESRTPERLADAAMWVIAEIGQPAFTALTKAEKWQKIRQKAAKWKRLREFFDKE